MTQPTIGHDSAIALSDEEAEVWANDRCPKCNGSGQRPKGSPVYYGTCRNCRGSGLAAKNHQVSFPKPGAIIRDPNNPNRVWVANAQGLVLHSLKPVW
jgi:hypothetical protein